MVSRRILGCESGLAWTERQNTVGRGLVIGAPSFGKGSVQTLYPLPGDMGARLRRPIDILRGRC